MMTTVRAAVIGAGSMGANHARVYSELDDVDLVGVADPNAAAAAAVSRRYHTKAYSDGTQLLAVANPDVASVTVPTRLHEAVALEAIDSGVHVLVEKPLAPTIEAAVRIIEAAARRGVKLAVGHIERFNPAVMEIGQRLRRQELGRLFQVHARRLSPFPNRIDDVGVILDLATHDIDVMRHLLASEVDRVFAEVERKVHATQEDLVTAVMRFSNGVIGLLDVNWLTPTKVRQLAILGEQGMYLADYLTQDLYWYQNTEVSGGWETLNVFRGAREGDMVKIRLDKKEPLRLELESFVAAVRADREPLVTGRDGLAAIAIGDMLRYSGGHHAPVESSAKGGQE
jgi:predicted dehydrogenase